MYPISDLFNEYLQRRSRNWLLKVNIAGTEYGSDAVVDFKIENNLTSGQEFEIGRAIISKLTLRMKTSDEIPSNAKIVPYVALAGEKGQTEWLPLGEFYIDNREQNKDVWEFTCLDKLIWASVPFVSQLTYPTTMKAVWDEICTSLGYSYDGSVVIDPTYQFQAGPAGFTKLQVLGYIAAANAASVYAGKDGVLRFCNFSAAEEPVTELTASDYIRVKQTNPVKTYTRIVVVYDSEDGLSYEAGSGDENHTLYVDLPFATQAITNDLYAKLNGFSYLPIEMDARGYPQIELGDRFRFGRAVDSPAWAAANVAWQDAAFTWDGYEYGSGGISLALNQTYSFRGGLKMTIDAPSKSEQRSEFEIDGSLSGQINRLNQNAVKLGKAYYGVSVSREEGWIVQREDGLSKAIFNSDDLSFWADGERALWFDLPSRKFKFSGTLEAADGVFSGELSAATGTFDGVFTGTITTDQLVAGTAKISTALIEDLVVGGNVQMGPNATISWGQLTDIPADAIFNPNYIKSTYIDQTQILSPSISAGTITGASIIGGSITSDTVINVGTDIYVGSNIHLQGASSTRTIFFGTSGAITANGDTISLSSPSGTSIVGGLFVDNINVISTINSKATLGVLTGSAGGHNHGITPGRYIMTYDSAGNQLGLQLWVAASDHSHLQN